MVGLGPRITTSAFPTLDLTILKTVDSGMPVSIEIFTHPLPERYFSITISAVAVSLVGLLALGCEPASPMFQERVLQEGHLRGVPLVLGNHVWPQIWHSLGTTGLSQQWEPQEGHLTGDSTLLNQAYWHLLQTFKSDMRFPPSA